jgi:hypothetical protein
MGSLRLEISKTREGGGRPGVEGTGLWTCRWEENRGREGKGRGPAEKLLAICALASAAPQLVTPCNESLPSCPCRRRVAKCA